MANMINDDLLQEYLMKSIEKQVAYEMEQAIEEAKEQIDKRLREKIAEITLGLLNMYSVEKRGLDVLITVKNQYLEDKSRGKG